MPTEAPTFIEAPEVAETVGFYTTDAFLQNRARLERDEDFPLPMPTSRRPLRWRRSEILSWLASSGLPPARRLHPDALASGKVVLLREAQRA